MFSGMSAAAPAPSGGGGGMFSGMTAAAPAPSSGGMFGGMSTMDSMSGGGGGGGMFGGMSTAAPAAPPAVAITPLVITTPQFGAQWTGQHACTESFEYRGPNCVTVQAFAQHLSSYGLHTVEIIAATSEAIFAGQSSAGVCLCHARVQAGTMASIQMKGADPTIANQLKAALA
tara:strand:- start:290 stop:808 length:519 start_codon:yes stop_codon:yes gene_type:complete